MPEITGQKHGLKAVVGDRQLPHAPGGVILAAVVYQYDFDRMGIRRSQCLQAACQRVE
jgi:hypothetical protein